MSSLKTQVLAAKERLRQSNDHLLHQEKLAEVEHRAVIEMENKCRTISQLLRNHNRGEGIPTPAPEFSENEIDDLRKELDVLETQFKNDEAKYERLHKKMNNDIEDVEKDNAILKLKLKEKDQDCKIKGMKIKELNRRMPRKTLGPIQTKNNQSKGMNQKGLATQYQSSIGSAKKAFNSTGKFHLLISLEFTDFKATKRSMINMAEMPTSKKTNRLAPQKRRSIAEGESKATPNTKNRDETSNITQNLRKNKTKK